MTTGFFERLEGRVAAAGSMLCVGLDPRVATPGDALEHCRSIIEGTAAHAAAFKPNSAFFEALGPDGLEALAEVIAAVPEEIPVLLDAKRGDISSTAAAYATAVFERLGAGAVTVSPYLGRDSIEPFLEHRGRGIFVLCRTSNPGGAEIQEAPMVSGEPLYLRVARLVAGWSPDRVGLVVGATEIAAIAKVRGVAPEHWILAPGVGAQGGSLEEAVAAGLRADGSGLLLPVSRAIAEASDPASVARDFNAAVVRARSAVEPAAAAAETGLALELFDAGCVRFGDFELKSGVRSPIYLDLRRLAGHPRLMQQAARRYLPLLAPQGGTEVPPTDRLRPSTPPQGGSDSFLDNSPLEGESASGASWWGGAPLRIAGVPLAGLPIATAVSLESGLPMVYPRPAAKDHGTRSAVEGPFEPGDRVVAIDDVATSGISIVQAVGRLRRAGLEVDAAVVLIDREAGATEALEAEGVELRSVLNLADVVRSLLAAGRITEAAAAGVFESLGG